MNAIATIPEEARLVRLRDAAMAAACCERTLKARLRKRGIPILAVSPRRVCVRLTDFNRFLQDCEQ